MRLPSKTHQWSCFPESYDTVEKSFDVALNTPEFRLSSEIYQLRYMRHISYFLCVLFPKMQKARLWGKQSVSTTVVRVFCVSQRHVYLILTLGEVINIHSSSDNLLEFTLWLGCFLAWWYWQVNSPHYASITSSMTWR